MKIFPAQCALFEDFQKKQTIPSRYGYKTSVHGRNSSFPICREQHFLLRESTIPNEDFIFLGKSDNRTSTLRGCPIVHLANSLYESRYRVLLNIENKMIVSSLLDPYRSSVVAPDHLIAGLAADILSLNYRALLDARSKTLVNSTIVDNLRKN